MKKYDVRGATAAVDRALAVTDNPKHRHILKNYRRHALLEISGYWEDILVPEMTVEQPVYRITERGETLVLTGMEEVSAFYAGITRTGDNVFGALDEQMAVSDYGLFIEAIFAQIVKGDHRSLEGQGTEADKFYQVSHQFAGVWPYREGRLYGEFIYEDATAWQIDEVSESDFITGPEAREMLAPFLVDSPFSEIQEGLKLFRDS